MRGCHGQNTSRLLVSLGALLLLTMALPSSAHSATRCGEIRSSIAPGAPGSIERIRASGVSCKDARKVAKQASNRRCGPGVCRNITRKVGRYTCRYGKVRRYEIPTWCTHGKRSVRYSLVVD